MADKFQPNQPYLFHYSDLDRMRKAYEGGNIPALYDAISCYRLFVQPLDLPCPIWILDGVINVMEDRLRSGKAIGKGKTGNESAKYKTNMMHFYRYEAVKAAREGGFTGEKVFVEASKILKGSFAWGLPKQVWSSDKIVNDALKTEEGKKRFYLAKYSPPKVTGS